VKKVQEEARALVRAQALLAAAPSLSPRARLGHPYGSIGWRSRSAVVFCSGGSRLRGRGVRPLRIQRSGAEGTRRTRVPNGSRLVADPAAERQYRDVSDDQEISLVRNSIAAQEFGSGLHRHIRRPRVSLAWRWPDSGWRPSLEAATSVTRTVVHASRRQGRSSHDPCSRASGATESLSAWTGHSLVPGGFRVGRSYLVTAFESIAHRRRIETAPAFSGGRSRETVLRIQPGVAADDRRRSPGPRTLFPSSISSSSGSNQWARLRFHTSLSAEPA